MKWFGRWSLQFAITSFLACAFCLPADAGVRQPKRIKSKKQLSKILRQHRPKYYAGFRTGLTALDEASGGPSTPATGGTFSSTLVQVAGVDEGDIVKNDGNFVYQINQGRVFIINAFPDTNLELVNTLDFTDGSFYPQELYLDQNRLVVIGTSFTEPSFGNLPESQPIAYFSTSTVKVMVYDVADPRQARKIRELEIQGDWVGSRKIGSSLYLVARQYPQFYSLLEADASTTRRGMVPKFRDSAIDADFHPLVIDNCFYFPGFDDPNYLIIAGVDLGNPDSELDLNAYLGAGELVYSSTQNLYVTASRPADIFFAPQVLLENGPQVAGLPSDTAPVEGTVIDPIAATPLSDEERTDIYKFSLNDSHTEFVGAGDVPGSILNQYSMDEYAGYFRVATTQHGWWTGSGQDTNNIFVFDSAMSMVGSVSNIALGEQIYAARFLGTRAFLVTFQQIDPLFAVDLTNPASPLIVGQLTLPGYSNFLLAYDETHLIGIGKDVIVAEDHTDGDVPWWNGAAFFQGMKLSLFDVTDLRNPVLLHSVSIGDRGTDSPALYDPHAILFAPDRNLLAFPIEIAQVQTPDPTQPWLWGDPIFQGTQVYDVSVANGFVLRGQVTQIPSGESIWDHWDKFIDRILFIDSDLFTLSLSELKVNDLASLGDKTTLVLPPGPENGGIGVVDPSETP